MYDRLNIGKTTGRNSLLRGPTTERHPKVQTDVGSYHEKELL